MSGILLSPKSFKRASNAARAFEQRRVSSEAPTPFRPRLPAILGINYLSFGWMGMAKVSDVMYVLLRKGIIYHGYNDPIVVANYSGRINEEDVSLNRIPLSDFGGTAAAPQYLHLVYRWDSHEVMFEVMSGIYGPTPDFYRRMLYPVYVFTEDNWTEARFLLPCCPGDVILPGNFA